MNGPRQMTGQMTKRSPRAMVWKKSKFSRSSIFSSLVIVDSMTLNERNQNQPKMPSVESRYRTAQKNFVGPPWQYPTMKAHILESTARHAMYHPVRSAMPQCSFTNCNESDHALP